MYFYTYVHVAMWQWWVPFVYLGWGVSPCLEYRWATFWLGLELPIYTLAFSSSRVAVSFPASFPHMATFLPEGKEKLLAPPLNSDTYLGPPTYSWCAEQFLGGTGSAGTYGLKHRLCSQCCFCDAGWQVGQVMCGMCCGEWGCHHVWARRSRPSFRIQVVLYSEQSAAARIAKVLTKDSGMPYWGGSLPVVRGGQLPSVCGLCLLRKNAKSRKYAASTEGCQTFCIVVVHVRERYREWSP
jgi:hypothetical protein